MVSIDTYRKLALALPGVEEKPHFENPSFRVNGKIFATLWTKENRAMIRLSDIDQSVFCAFDDTVFYPVPGAWGKKGCTFVNLATVRKDMFTDALTLGYELIKKGKKGK